MHDYHQVLLILTGKIPETSHAYLASWSSSYDTISTLGVIRPIHSQYSRDQSTMYSSLIPIVDETAGLLRMCLSTRCVPARLHPFSSLRKKNHQFYHYFNSESRAYAQYQPIDIHFYFASHTINGTHKRQKLNYKLTVSSEDAHFVGVVYDRVIFAGDRNTMAAAQSLVA